MEFANALYGDPDVERMLRLAGTSNPLRICFPKEIQISNMLAWLLDPSQAHGLGDHAIKSILTRAGQCEEAESLPANDRRFLAASSIHSQGFSSMVVATEVDVGMKDVKDRLDVLIVDAVANFYIAIENKFGAKQSDGQLKKYRKGLEKLFPDFRGVHIFLDSYEATVDDSLWLPIGYDWLSEFLRQCEQRDSVSDSVRLTLTQFRAVVEEEDEESAASTPLGKLVLQVATTHGDAVLAMKSLVDSRFRSTRAKELSSLLNDGVASIEGKANLRLFSLFCKRPLIWANCFRQVAFAPFVSRMRDLFPDVLIQPWRVRTAFSLNAFEQFIDKQGKDDDWNWTAGVWVRAVEEKFRVQTFLNLTDVKAEKKAALLTFANAERKKNGIRKSNDGAESLVLKLVSGLSQGEAVAEAVDQLEALRTGLDV
ncbi:MULTISPECIES: PD-(D/E)XK nuclease family protein [unclassified Variovorax]|uniref:PDDEXK-like family protein n=1 Tax=unclassified Variovorax TaxID=663243 RepID=UPI000A03B29C|nr:MULTISPECIES: PD-(D/E)XK nuclease family protein [unclassified Variovorax]PNG49077.1 hypothetical protein CHC06_06314 [Variovorax sp. B2]PNG49462.1 hypothetical protein CHC07_06371 [Variovorax sp. B4]VTV18914.1 hypothetical protein WDL1P2_00526 [Variovorax sp. WDL1]